MVTQKPLMTGEKAEPHLVPLPVRMPSERSLKKESESGFYLLLGTWASYMMPFQDSGLHSKRSRHASTKWEWDVESINQSY